MNILISLLCFSLNFPNGKTETVSITRRRMFARTLWGSRPLFAPMKSSCAKIHKSAARLLRHVPVHLPSSLCHIHGVNVASCNSPGCLKAEIGENSKPIRQCFTPVRRFQWHHQVQALMSEYKCRRIRMDWLQCLIVVRAFKLLFNRIPVLFRYLPSRFPTDSFNFSVSSSHFRSKLAHCCITQLQHWLSWKSQRMPLPGCLSLHPPRIAAMSGPAWHLLLPQAHHDVGTCWRRVFPSGPER